jgi:hypothetical protein
MSKTWVTFTFFLGLEIRRSYHYLTLTHKYNTDLLAHSEMSKSKPVDTSMSYVDLLSSLDGNTLPPEDVT